MVSIRLVVARWRSTLSWRQALARLDLLLTHLGEQLRTSDALQQQIEALQTKLDAHAASVEELRTNKDFVGNLGWLLVTFATGLGGGLALASWLRERLGERPSR